MANASPGGPGLPGRRPRVSAGAPQPTQARPNETTPPDLLQYLATTRGVRRDALLRRLGTLDPTVALVLVVAPAGYGKTTLVRQWAEDTGRPFVWLSMDAAGGIPSRLVDQLLAALLGIRAPDADAEPALSVADEPSLAASALAAAVRAVGEPVLVLLDDLHRIRTRESLALLVGLAARLPTGSRVVATADRHPRLQVGALASSHRYLELGASDLVFSREETAELLDLSGLPLPDDDLDELVRRTESWPAGVQLATLVLQEKRDPAAAVWALAGDNEVFGDYFRDEVLAGLSADTVRFLLRTAVLDRVNGALCDAALDTAGSTAWLREVDALGLPIVQLDDRGEWYRYPRLFAEMLRAELRRREPGEDLKVLRRAARWYLAQGMPEQAVASALAGQEPLVAARAIVASVQELNSKGRIGDVRQWIEELGEGMLERYPPLAAIGAWVWALTGDAARARHALRVAETAAGRDAPQEWSPELASAVLRARAGLAPDGVDVMMTDAEAAVALESPGSHWHTLSAVLLGVANRLAGATDEAERWFEQAARFGRTQQRPGAAFALAEHALLAADRGDWATAEACAYESAELVRKGHLWAFPPAVATHVAEARVARHRGDGQRAAHTIQAAVELYRTASPVAFPWLAAQTSVELGRLLLADDVAAAQAMLADARRHLAVLPTAGVLKDWEEALADDVRAALGHSDAGDAAPLTKAELRVLSLLPTHLSLAQIGEELVISRNTVKSQVAAVYRKLGAANRDDAVRRAIRGGLLAPDPGRAQPPRT